MRRLALVCLVACGPPPGYGAGMGEAMPAGPAVPVPTIDMAHAGTVVDRLDDFAFAGGRIELEMRRDGDHIYEVAHNHYIVPIVIAWQLTNLDNLEPLSPITGVVRLPAAGEPGAEGPPVVLAQLQIVDPSVAYHRYVSFRARFGDPDARPQPYAYRLPYRHGTTFSVLQGFHGAFSHRGSNEYAVDFDCPVATHVLAARPGIVVASNDAAQGAGTTPDFLDYQKTNFVLVLHDDGTLGEYMHLAPSGVKVQPGQHVARGDDLALSGNTGYSSTPHLHFQVMTAGDDGRSARSFPFVFAVAPDRTEEPVQGRAYRSWE